MIPDVFFQLNTPLAIIIYSLQSIIDLAGRKNESILFTMGNDRLEPVIVAHISGKDIATGG
jgi:hypothetical protein